MQEISPAHTELLEAAKFAELRSKSGDKLLVLLWSYGF
jgi:hypothetical protein